MKRRLKRQRRRHQDTSSVACTGLTTKGSPCKNSVSVKRESNYWARWCGRCRPRGNASMLRADAADASMDDVLAAARRFAADGWRDENDEVVGGFGLLAVVRAAQREGVTSTSEMLELLVDEVLARGDSLVREDEAENVDDEVVALTCRAFASELLDAWQTAFPFDDPAHTTAHIALLSAFYNDVPQVVLDAVAEDFHSDIYKQLVNAGACPPDPVVETHSLSDASVFTIVGNHDTRDHLLRELTARNPEMHPNFRLATLLALSTRNFKSRQSSLDRDEYERAWLQQVEQLPADSWNAWCEHDIRKHHDPAGEIHHSQWGHLGICGNLIGESFALPSGAAQDQMMALADDYAGRYRAATGEELFDVLIPVGWRATAQHDSDKFPTKVENISTRNRHSPTGDRQRIGVSNEPLWPEQNSDPHRWTESQGADPATYSEKLNNYGSHASVHRWVRLENPPTRMLELAAYMPSLAAVVAEHPRSSDDVRRTARATLALHDGGQGALRVPDPGSQSNTSSDDVDARRCNRYVIDAGTHDEDESPYVSSAAVWRRCRNLVTRTSNNGWCGQCRGWERAYAHAFGDNIANRGDKSTQMRAHNIPGLVHGCSDLLLRSSDTADDEMARRFAEVFIADDTRTYITHDGMHQLASPANALDGFMGIHGAHVTQTNVDAFQHAAEHADDTTELLATGLSDPHDRISRSALPVPSLKARGFDATEPATIRFSAPTVEEGAPRLRVFYDGNVMSTYIADDHGCPLSGSPVVFTDFSFPHADTATLLDGQGVDVDVDELADHSVGGFLVDDDKAQILPDDLFNGNDDQQQHAAFRSLNWCAGDTSAPRNMRTAHTTEEFVAGRHLGAAAKFLRRGITPCAFFPENVVNRDTGHINVDASSKAVRGTAAISTQALNAVLADAELSHEEHVEQTTHAQRDRCGLYVALQPNHNGIPTLRTFEHRVSKNADGLFDQVNLGRALEMPVGSTQSTESSINPSDQGLTYFPASALRVAVDSAIEHDSPVVSLVWGADDAIANMHEKITLRGPTGAYIHVDKADVVKGSWVYVDADVAASKSRRGLMIAAHTDPGLVELSKRPSFTEALAGTREQNRARAQASVAAHDNPIAWAGWDAAETLMNDTTAREWRDRIQQTRQTSSAKQNVKKMLQQVSEPSGDTG